jgi:cytoskeletal protein CcmA (bactofilin family)
MERRIQVSSRIHGEDAGFAMVFALMVVFVVVLLSIAVLDLSIHNSEQSAYDRKRVTSVSAAEGGLDAAWTKIQTLGPQSLPCGSPDTGSLASAPGPAGYSVEYTWYDAAGAPLACPLSQTNVPASVLVTSTGTTNTDVPRKVQAYMTLTPTYGGFGEAVLAVTNTTFNNNFTISGNIGNDGDVYVTNGNLTITNSPNVYGNIYVPNGSVTMSNNSHVFGNLWANGSITMNNPASVTGNVTSSISSIGGTGAIGGDARAGTTISGVTVGGSSTPNSPQGPPPTVPFPLLCQVAIAGVCNALPWTGYTLHTYTGATACSSARTFLTGAIPAGDHLVWINQVCNLSIANNDAITFTGNLAIVTQGGISMANRNNWNGVDGKSLFFIVNYRQGLSCASGSYNVSTGNNSSFNNADTFFYSPCTVTLNNLNDFSGQVLGNSVVINNHFTMDYVPVLVPGAGSIVGFNQSVVYVREVK